MAAEYVIAGRRPLPGEGTWVWYFDLEDEDDDDDVVAFEGGGFELCAIERSGNDDFFAWVEKRAGFAPESVVTIRKAGWEFSRAAAEVVAAALDGVYFIDVVEDALEPAVAPTAPATSTAELEARIEAASREPAKIFARWAAEEAAAQEEHDRKNPADAARRKNENDWSDI